MTVVQTSRPPVPRSVKEEVAYRRSSRCGSSSSGDREVASGDERLVWRTPANPAPVPPRFAQAPKKSRTAREIQFGNSICCHSLSSPDFTAARTDTRWTLTLSRRCRFLPYYCTSPILSPVSSPMALLRQRTHMPPPPYPVRLRTQHRTQHRTRPRLLLPVLLVLFHAPAPARSTFFGVPTSLSVNDLGMDGANISCTNETKPVVCGMYSACLRFNGTGPGRCVCDRWHSTSRDFPATLDAWRRRASNATWTAAGDGEGGDDGGGVDPVVSGGGDGDEGGVVQSPTLPPRPQPCTRQRPSRRTAACLTIFLGWLGLGALYMGWTTWFVIPLVIFIAGCCCPCVGLACITSKKAKEDGDNRIGIAIQAFLCTNLCTNLCVIITTLVWIGGDHCISGSSGTRCRVP